MLGITTRMTRTTRTLQLNFSKGTVLGNKEQRVGIRDKGQRLRVKTKMEFNTKDQVLLLKILFTTVALVFPQNFCSQILFT